MIALMSALVVMLAATLLITLADRMVNGHADRIADTQIALSEASAADGLAWLLQCDGAGAVSGPVSFELAGVTTEFTLTGSGSSGIRTGFFSIDHPENTVAVPAGQMLITVTSAQGEGTVFSFYGNENFQVNFSYYLEESLIPLGGTPLINTEEADAVFILGSSEGNVLCAVGPEGIIALSEVQSIYAPSNGHMSGAVIDGSPFLITTGGGNTGVIHDVSTGASAHISTPAGTCPAFWPDGSIFGETGAASPSFSLARVRDVFYGDFNSDGRDDIAFTTDRSLSWVSGATSDIYRTAPGGSLVCWGEVENRNGLVGMWKPSGGDPVWYRASWDGFAQFVPENIYQAGWEGRFTASGNTFAGFIDGAAVVRSSSGFFQQLFPDQAFFGDADKGALDFFRTVDDGLEACFNPVYGDGIRLVFDSRNSWMGNTEPGGTHVFNLYETGTGTRVFHDLEGVNR